MNKTTLVAMSLILLASPLYANNIQITNASLSGQSAVNDTYQVQFDISWENSWRTSTLESNYDAAWVFIKFRVQNPLSEWQHAVLNTSGFIAPGGATVEPSSDGMGAFIFRDANGIGNIDFQGVELQWNYGSAIEDDDIVEICIFAIEMVYIPEGPFHLGDNANFFGVFEEGTSGNPKLITSENGLILGGLDPNGLNNHNTTIDDFRDLIQQNLPAAFPKGYQAFYIMKYELSQGQYAAFLNKLTQTQINARFGFSNVGTSGYTIHGQSGNIGPFTADVPDRACNFINLADANAYADWAGLRLTTELEFEKAARGSLFPVMDEYAWGNAELNLLDHVLANADQPTESISNLAVGIGNVHFSGNRAGESDRPLRCGIFAASAVNATREETGASYYGVMEMSGNLSEFMVGVGNAEMRAYTGLHGDGALTTNGLADIANYPVNSIIQRGSGYLSSNSPISRRFGIFTSTSVSSRFSSLTTRLCRTAN